MPFPQFWLYSFIVSFVLFVCLINLYCNTISFSFVQHKSFHFSHRPQMYRRWARWQGSNIPEVLPSLWDFVIWVPFPALQIIWSLNAFIARRKLVFSSKIASTLHRFVSHILVYVRWACDASSMFMHFPGARGKKNIIGETAFTNDGKACTHTHTQGCREQTQPCAHGVLSMSKNWKPGRWTHLQNW